MKTFPAYDLEKLARLPKTTLHLLAEMLRLDMRPDEPIVYGEDENE